MPSVFIVGLKARIMLFFSTLLIDLPSASAEQVLKYTEFESEVEQVINQSGDSDWYLDNIISLKEKHAPLTEAEKAYALYLECVNDGTSEVPQELVQAKGKKGGDFQVALHLCHRFEHKQTQKTDEAFQKTFLAYRQQEDIVSAPLRYLTSFFYANSAMKQGLFAEGIKATSVMLDVALENNFEHLISQAYSTRALLQIELQQLDAAIENIDKSIEFANTHWYKTNRLLDKGYILSSAQENKRAIAVYNQITADPKNADDDILKLIVYSNLSYIYSNTKQKNKNLDITKKQLSLARDVGDDFYLAQAELSRAYALLDSGNYSAAHELFYKADKWFADNNYDVRTAEGYETWSKLLFEQGYYKEAYDYLQKSVALNKEIDKSKGMNEIDTIQAILDAEEKQRQLNEANLALALIEEKQSAREILILVVFISAVVVISITLYGYLRVRRLNRALDTANSTLEYENSRDSLTGAYNRRFFYRFIEQEKAKSSTAKALIGLIDIDHFKSLNDNYGHDVGDQVLKIVVERLINTTKKSDKVIRWGGEEFLIYLSVNDSIENTKSALERVVNEVNRNPVQVNQGLLSVTISMGFKIIALDSVLQTELQEIDEYLYQAKDRGRKQAVGIFDSNSSIEVIS
ncbi:GGDEF domain-containing protein [Idiomarina loihiensis]|uniref:tetratricopeptide repeat-containing diguanylate cyclase n=1 Tax=Idiomarina loihiensis TaxID=135577 RepID=UPI0031595FDB